MQGREQTVPVEKIRVDGGTQLRAAIDDATVRDYAEAIAAGGKFPRVVLYQDGIQLWLGDGFHRYFAHRRAGCEQIDALIYPGTQRDAILYAAGCNSGLRRTAADIERAVSTLLADADWSKRSDRWIAEACRTSAYTVAKVRGQTSTARARAVDPEPVRRVGRDGRERALPQAKPKPVPVVVVEADVNWSKLLGLVDAAANQLDKVCLHMGRIRKADAGVAAAVAIAKHELRKAKGRIERKIRWVQRDAGVATGRPARRALHDPRKLVGQVKPARGSTDVRRSGGSRAIPPSFCSPGK